MKECANCGFQNDYGACNCPHSDKWYACPIEAKKPENIKALKDYAEWASKAESEDKHTEERTETHACDSEEHETHGERTGNKEESEDTE